MSAKLNLAEAYAKVVGAAEKLDTARREIAEHSEYDDPPLRDVDDAWRPVNDACVALRRLVSERGE